MAIIFCVATSARFDHARIRVICSEGSQLSYLVALSKQLCERGPSAEGLTLQIEKQRHPGPVPHPHEQASKMERPGTCGHLPWDTVSSRFTVDMRGSQILHKPLVWINLL